MSGCTFFATVPQEQHSITSSGGRFTLWVEHHFDPIVGDQHHTWATPRLQPHYDTGPEWSRHRPHRLKLVF